MKQFKLLSVCALGLVMSTSPAQSFGTGGFGGFGGFGGTGSIGGVSGLGNNQGVRDAIEGELGRNGVTVDLDTIEDIAQSNISDLTGITANVISDQIGAGREFCAGVQRDYRISCIADRFESLARQLPRSGDYREIRKGLQKAARDLDKVTRQFADAGTRKQRFGSGSGDDTIRTGRLTSIDPARRAAAERAAKAVIGDLETVLLRSATSEREQRAMYQKISAAVGSNKLILRS